MQPFDAALSGAREIAVPGHLHDHHAGRGLRADRLRLGPDRRAVPRVRLHAGRRGDRVGHHRADAVADDVLEAAQGGARRSGPASRASSIALFERPEAALPAAPAPHAQLSAGDAAGAGRRHRRDRPHVHDDAEGAGAGGGPGHPLQPRQDAAVRQSRLSRAGHRPALQGVRDGAGEGARLHHQRHGQRRASGLRRHPVQAVGGARRARRSRSCRSLQPKVAGIAGGAGDLVLAAVAAGLDRRAAGAVRHHHHGATTTQLAAGAGRGADRRRSESGLFIFTDCGPQASRRRRSSSRSTTTRPTGSASPWPDIGGSLATLLGGNYVNRSTFTGAATRSSRRCRATSA